MNIFRDTCDVPLAHIIKDKVTGEHKGCMDFNFVTRRLCLYLRRPRLCGKGEGDLPRQVYLPKCTRLFWN